MLRHMETLSLATRRKLTLAPILGSSLAFIDAAVVFVALPTMEEELDLGLTGQQWIVLSYSLALASLYLVGGAVGDWWGRRSTFIAGAAGFAVASALAGAAPNGELLIVARTLQGVAGAFLTTNSLALIRAVYVDEAGRAIGLGPRSRASPRSSVRQSEALSSNGSRGAGSSSSTCRWRRSRWSSRDRPLRRAGPAASRPPRHPWSCSRGPGLRHADVRPRGGHGQGFADVWWAFAIAVLSMAAFVWVELRADEPMLPFELFRRRNFLFANLETFVVYGALYGQLVYVQLFLQFLGFSPFEASLISIPASAIMILLASRFGSLADRHGPRLYLTLGPFLVGVGIL